ncbi:MAG: primosomal protein N' [Clostridia bacterium]|nr:primosomal protein N' [Clostridia bacterium]
MIATVMLTDKRHALSQPFDYKIPPEITGKVLPGMRVLVPFGVHNTSTEGLVLSLAETSSFPRLKTIQRCLDEEPVCTEELLQLAFWMQEKYLCSFQQSYKLVKPPFMGAHVREWLVLRKEPETVLTPAQFALYKALKEHDGLAELKELEAALSKRSLRAPANALAELGVLELRETIDETVTVKFIRKAHLNCSAEEGYALADELMAKRATAQANLILTLCDSGDLPTADLVMIAEGNYTSLRTLCEKGVVTVYREQVEREAFDAGKYCRSRAYVPTPEQKPIIEHLNRNITHQFHEEILLHGVTGSGKTEVFLQAIETCINQGKQAIMLVPEISLTPQMVERFVSRFGSGVAVMHSGLSQGERFDQWQKMRRGEVDVVVGARSAVFAPFENIGIIILDEEHESSYKSEIAPRYHAREVAFRRGRKHGAPVLLASATPSVESFYRAETGRYKLFRMEKRYNENDLPATRIVDMRSELFDYHNMSPISIRLQDEIRRNLERGEKTILFLNRRGYNTFVSCRECGQVIECPHCSIAMTYHRNTDKLVCHYCGHTQDNVTSCPTCGSKYVKFFGTGTQKIETELNQLFPEARILRMDFDTTSQKGGHEAILNRFKNGEGDILLGTQMVTKGLDFPEVTLVGVLAADSSLHVDDYRSGERCFSLITQVCGRAGRGDLAGRAVIQTYQPQNSTILFAKEQNYDAFYENEIQYRKRMQYPPFCDFIYILVSGEDAELAEREIGNIAGILKNAGIPILKCIGPGLAPIGKIKNKFRYRLLCKVADAEDFLPVLREISQEHNGTRWDNRLVIDINPINML